jgi:RimJ/RimL family protein N-acetyltransferase
LAGKAQAETVRLSCVRPSPGAVTGYRRLFTDPEVERWLRPPPLDPFRDGEVDRILEHDLRHWEVHGFGPWALHLREGGEFVGRAGLVWTRVEGSKLVELPWAVLPEFQRRGIATEAGRAALGVALGLGLGPLASLTLPDNLASRAVMEKLGFRYERDVQHAGLPHVLYSFDGSTASAVAPDRVWQLPARGTGRSCH